MQVLSYLGWRGMTLTKKYSIEYPLYMYLVRLRFKWNIEKGRRYLGRIQGERGHTGTQSFINVLSFVGYKTLGIFKNLDWLVQFNRVQTFQQITF